MIAERGAGSPPIDLVDFEIDLGKVKLAVNEQLAEIFEESQPSISLPACWGDSDGNNGPPPDDPLMLRIHLPLGSEDSEPYWEVSLVDVLEDFLEDVREDTSYAEGCLRIAVALAALVERISAAVATGEENVRRKEDGGMRDATVIR